MSEHLSTPPGELRRRPSALWEGLCRGQGARRQVPKALEHFLGQGGFAVVILAASLRLLTESGA